MKDLLIITGGCGFVGSNLIEYLIKKTNYKIISHNDKRGKFFEFFKSRYSGQVSFLTINPGQTRGFHYHNTKYEKFIVVEGKVTFCYRDFFKKKINKKTLNESTFTNILSIPGYVHYLKNDTKKISKVILWSNEVYNQLKPDTYLVNEKN